MRSDVDSFYEKKLEKTIIEKGEESEMGQSFPKRFNEVEINFWLRYNDSKGLLIDSAEDPNQPYVFKVGDSAILSGINLAVSKMTKGELSEFILPPEMAFEEGNIMGATPGVPLYLKIKLIDFREVEITRFDLEEDERLIFAQKYKDKGNEAYQQNQLENAELLFKKAYDFIEWEKKEEFISLRIKILLNLSLILSKLGKSFPAIERAKLAINLDPKNPKAYYRRALARLNISEFDKSIEDIKKGLEIEPNNKGLINLWKDVKLKKDKYIRENQSMFNKALNKIKETPEKVISEFSEETNPILKFFIKKENGSESFLYFELFETIYDEVVKILVKELSKGKIQVNNYAKSNYIEFSLENFEETEDLVKNNLPAPSIKFEEAGYVYIDFDQEKNILVFGISLAPLPWFNSKKLIIGKICAEKNNLKFLDEKIQNIYTNIIKL